MKMDQGDKIIIVRMFSMVVSLVACQKAKDEEILLKKLERDLIILSNDLKEWSKG